MNISVSTPVNQPIEQVWDNFNEKLFEALNPPFPPVAVKRFDGSNKGDEVHLELNFLLFKQDWVSLIIEQNAQSEEIYFIDEGVKLPFFLKSWRHKHRIIKNKAGGSVIKDEISFKSPFLLLDWLLYPSMLLQFAYRKPIYKKFFA